ncbi:hypothetical protein NIES4071_41370 [Calothrix sp. NIES-4071]|nr:hypothetical protein NIES4071_41370 [Calothrix sp. NIES-4071]BAZ58453.1 hypothetical protein NIES4105_41310 [Calothrix sp. NIES-4105]
MYCEPICFLEVFLVEITGIAYESITQGTLERQLWKKYTFIQPHKRSFQLNYVKSHRGDVSPSQGVSMNSDLMPSTEPILPVKSNPDSTIIEASVDTPTQNHASIEESSSDKNETANLKSENRLSPIPPPSEPMQYRAIGLIRGRYVSSAEQFTQGSLVTADGASINTVLLGRMMSLVKNHLDLEQEHLWVVYPRTRQENDQLHLQIVGVWEPEKLAKSTPSIEQTENYIDSSESTPSSVLDGKFSVRGEVVYQAQDGSNLVIKIKQAPRKQDDKPKYFKLKLKGNLEMRAVGKFWDLEVIRQGDDLAIESGKVIADLPKKRRPPFKGGAGGGKRPFNSFNKGGSKKPFKRPSNGETPLPIKKGSPDFNAAPRPVATSGRPTPKPVKRPKPEE